MREDMRQTTTIAETNVIGDKTKFTRIMKIDETAITSRDMNENIDPNIDGIRHVPTDPRIPPKHPLNISMTIPMYVMGLIQLPRSIWPFLIMIIIYKLITLNLFSGKRCGITSNRAGP
jgi:hypothetical protein